MIVIKLVNHRLELLVAERLPQLGRDLPQVTQADAPFAILIKERERLLVRIGPRSKYARVLMRGETMGCVLNGEMMGACFRIGENMGVCETGRVTTWAKTVGM